MRYLSNVSTLRFIPGKCTGCGRCIEVCPHAVFSMRGKKTFIEERDRCMECGACAKNCAFSALSVRSGVGCASAMITSMIRGGEPTCDCKEGVSSCC